MFQLRLAAALEVLDAAVGRESCRIPETDRILNAQLILECSQRRGRVIGPISPCAASEAILSMETMQNSDMKCRKHRLSVRSLMYYKVSPVLLSKYTMNTPKQTPTAQIKQMNIQKMHSHNMKMQRRLPWKTREHMRLKT